MYETEMKGIDLVLIYNLIGKGPQASADVHWKQCLPWYVPIKSDFAPSHEHAYFEHDALDGRLDI